jgi:hypothetical protein
MTLIDLANPTRFLALTARVLPWLIAATAILLAVGLYYRHFTDVSREAFARVRAPAAAGVVEPPSPESAAGSTETTDAADAGRVAALVRPLSWAERTRDAMTQTRNALGWPLLVLAAIGAWRAVRAGRRDRLSIVVAAWVGVWGLFMLAGTLTRVDTQYQRYASEFMGRVNLATYPAAVLLAAFGAAWPWTCGTRRSWTLRAITAAIVLFAVRVGVHSWLAWTP